MRLFILLALLAASAADSPPAPPPAPLYLIGSGACVFTGSGAGAHTQACSTGSTPVEGNTLRAGFVWSGSVRGNVDTSVNSTLRRNMNITVGSRSYTSDVVTIPSCATADACTLTMAMDGSLANLATMGWAVLSPYPPAEPTVDWFGWEYDLNYVVAGLFAVPAIAYAIYVFVLAPEKVVEEKQEVPRKRRHRKHRDEEGTGDSENTSFIMRI